MDRNDPTPPVRARVPADVDRPDKLMAGLTARQLVILTVAGLLLYAAWSALLPVVPPLPLAMASLPVAGFAVAVATVRRDGISLDRWLLAALRHRRSPRVQVPATAEQIMSPPGWVAATGGGLRLPAPLRLPAKRISADGVVDLGGDGHVGLADCATVNFTLRSPAEQHALVGGFAGFLHSLDSPVQILVRAHRVRLDGHAARVRAAAADLPDPALEQAARSYADFLDELGVRRELLHRQVTLAVRDKRSPAYAMHRVADAARALASCEVSARPLDAPGVAGVLAAACQPNQPAPSALAGGGPQ